MQKKNSLGTKLLRFIIFAVFVLAALVALVGILSVDIGPVLFAVGMAIPGAWWLIREKADSTSAAKASAAQSNADFGIPSYPVAEHVNPLRPTTSVYGAPMPVPPVKKPRRWLAVWTTAIITMITGSALTDVPDPESTPATSSTVTSSTATSTTTTSSSRATSSRATSSRATSSRASTSSSASSSRSSAAPTSSSLVPPPPTEEPTPIDPVEERTEGLPPPPPPAPEPEPAPVEAAVPEPNTQPQGFFAPAPAPEPAPQPAPAYVGSCREARALGIAPIYAGSPYYSTRLDRDGDGVACE